MSEIPHRDGAPDGRPVWLPVSAVVVTGLVINWISDEVKVSPPILLLLAAAALGLLVAAEHSSRVTLPFTDANLDLSILDLLAVLLGAAIGGVSVIPLLPERSISVPWGSYFHNYEAGSAVTIAILASISAVRLKEPVQWLTFLAASVAGMTLAVVYIRSDNAFVPTFAGWLAATTLVTTVVANGRELVQVLLQFLGFKDRPSSNVSKDPEADSLGRRVSGTELDETTSAADPRSGTEPS